MKYSKKGTSIIEAMVVMLIVVTWVVGMYNIFNNSRKVSDSTSYRVQAIAMAKEWIEALTNIRDTNWLLYSANTENCWNTFDYQGACITSTGHTIPSGSYLIYQNTNNRWYLSGVSVSWDYSTGSYRDAFRIHLDDNWFYTQSWGSSFFPIFTREIKINYIDSEINPPQKMKVESIVKWTDNARVSWNYEVKLETILTNWKK